MALVYPTFRNNYIVDYGWDRTIYIPKTLKDYRELLFLIREDIVQNYFIDGLIRDFIDNTTDQLFFDENSDNKPIPLRRSNRKLDTRIIPLNCEDDLIGRVDRSACGFSTEAFFYETINRRDKYEVKNRFNNISQSNNYVQFQLAARRDF